MNGSTWVALAAGLFVFGAVLSCASSVVPIPTPTPIVVPAATAESVLTVPPTPVPSRPAPADTPASTPSFRPVPEPTAVPPPAPTLTPRGFNKIGAIGVMIDDDPQAHPQTGLNAADVVYEMVAEFNLTRFLAIYFADAPATVGSIRSTRPYFAEAMTEYGGGLVHCLDVPGVRRILAAGNVFNFDVCHGQGEEGAFRTADRVAPFNLYVNAGLLQRELRLRPSRPAAALEARAHLSASASPVEQLTVVYPLGHTVVWTWNGKVYARREDGVPHRLADGQVITTDTIVVQWAQTQPTSYFGDAGYHIVDLIDAGKALILANGRSQPARWSRPSASSPTRFANAQGITLKLPPGRIFFQVVPLDAKVTTQ